MYREAKTHRMPYLYKVTFPPKSPTIGGSSVMRAMCRVHMCDTWCSYVWLNTVIRKTLVNDVSHIRRCSYVRHVVFICVTRHSHTCDVTCVYMCCDSLICVIWLIRMCDVTQPYGCCDLSIWGTRLQHTATNTHDLTATHCNKHTTSDRNTLQQTHMIWPRHPATNTLHLTATHCSKHTTSDRNTLQQTHYIWPQHTATNTLHLDTRRPHLRQPVLLRRLEVCSVL